MPIPYDLSSPAMLRRILATYRHAFGSRPVRHRDLAGLCPDTVAALSRNGGIATLPDGRIVIAKLKPLKRS